MLTEQAYDASTGRLTAIQTADGYLQDLHYDYDALGNVTWREDRTNMAALKESFTYDRLQRLLSATVTDHGAIQPGQASYSYAGDGNIASKTGLGSYVYGTFASGCSGVSGSATPCPHAVSEADGTRHCYDANGNLPANSGSHVFRISGDWMRAAGIKSGHVDLFQVVS